MRTISRIERLAVMTVSALALTTGSALAAPSCGTDPVMLNAYFETGFPLAGKLADEFTKQFPNVTFDIKEDQFANLMENSPRVLSGDNAPDLIRLPSHERPRRQRLLLESRSLLRPPSAGTSPRRPARAAARRRWRPPARHWLALRHGPQLFDDRRLLQQGRWPKQIGMTEAPETVAELDAVMAEGQGRRHPADRSVEQGAPAASPSRCRTSWVPTAHPSRSMTGSSRRTARRSTRQPT